MFGKMGNEGKGEDVGSGEGLMVNKEWGNKLKDRSKDKI